MASQVESEAMQNLPDWQTMPRPMITSDMLSEVSFTLIKFSTIKWINPILFQIKALFKLHAP